MARGTEPGHVVDVDADVVVVLDRRPARVNADSNSHGAAGPGVRIVIPLDRDCRFDRALGLREREEELVSA